MKWVGRRFAAMTVAAMTVAGVLSGCGTQGSSASGQSNSSTDKTYTVGIAQYAEFPALDDCRKGFQQGMAAEGFVDGKNVKYDYQNSQGDAPTAQQIATNFVSKKYDLIAAIATPAAQATFNVAESAQIPVIYLAVSDPVAAGLAGSDGTSGKLMSGISDVISPEAQMAMIRQFMPNAKKIGILYSTSEVNSETQLKMYQKAAPTYGFEIVPSGVATSADIALATDSLLPKVDCLSNLTDNTIVGSLATILDKANAAKKPVFGSESKQVENGCLASIGVDYVKLGKQAGVMAAKALKGEDLKTMKFETVKEYSTDVNTTAMKNLGLTLPKALEGKATLHS